MIHYFNPGHETAVLNASKYYRPPRMVVKMQEDLALLPVWYASPGDSVLAGCTEHGARLTDALHRVPCTVYPAPVEPWGLSPQSIHYLETLNEQYGWQLQIPEWKDEYRFLGSRFAAQKALESLIEAIPEIDKIILPQFYSTIEDIEKVLSIHCTPCTFRPSPFASYLIKSPYSSSGRGLLWLPPGKLAQSERQIISGMLKKQSRVSLEKALDKRLDFSMHFEITQDKETHFIGYSVFQTNAKGAYESSLLANQEILEKQITDLIDKDSLQKVQENLIGILQEMYSPYYTGNLGVDMLAYFSENRFRLHPCVEINMRKSMGYLAIRLFENHICPASQGQFFVEYHKSAQTLNEKHLSLQKQYPLQIENNRICSGYLSLCPVMETTNYLAYILLPAF
ncbi:hypothetical protein AGMMS50239_17500 [Bacteroidia bacterium]|nr:hypothetical protein AGMMS50239_17500 [Bacteroidia bacterium]